MGKSKKNLVIWLGVGATLGELETLKKCKYTTEGFFNDYNNIIKTHPFLWRIVDILHQHNVPKSPSLTILWLTMQLIAKNYLRNKYRQGIILYDNFKYEEASFHRILDENGKEKILEWFPFIYSRWFEMVQHSFPTFQYIQFLVDKSNAAAYRSKLNPSDPHDAFNTMANFELQNLLIERYTVDYNTTPKNSPHQYLAKRIQELASTYNISIVNTNYDITFEQAYQRQIQSKVPLKKFFYCNPLLEEFNFDNYYEDFLSQNKNSAVLLKPHAGFNIYHDSKNAALFFYDEHIGFDTKNFKKLRSDDVLFEPYLIPYFLSPDEFEKTHNDRFKLVGYYFYHQKKMLKKILEKAKCILAIGYSFPDDDKHLYLDDAKDAKNMLGNKKWIIINRIEPNSKFYNENIKNNKNEIYPLYMGEGYSINTIDKAIDILYRKKKPKKISF